MAQKKEQSICQTCKKKCDLRNKLVISEKNKPNEIEMIMTECSNYDGK
jgi:hypothetical protein